MTDATKFRTEGKIPFEVPLNFSGDEEVHAFTYYKVVGDLTCGSPPVIFAHGGPGAGHEYLLPFTELWPKYGLPVIFYDQLGCGSSMHLRNRAGDRMFWTMDLFLAELNNLIDHLHLRDGAGFHFFGQSWGGMLGASFGCSRPHGLKRLVLSSGLASMETSLKGKELLVEKLPQEARDAIAEGRRNNDFHSPKFKEAMGVFSKTYLCRYEPFPPPEMLPSMKHFSDDTTVYGTMIGESILAVNGTLLDWTSIPDLPQISVPTLVYNGEFDTSPDMATKPFADLILDVRWIKFEGAGHMCHLEADGIREKVIGAVGDFLTAK